MECKDVRKKLKEYADGRIYDALENDNMEAHVKECPVCIRELALWQEVLDKQKITNRLSNKVEFSERIRKRNRKSTAGMNLPPMARRILATQNMMMTGMGCLIMQIILLTAFVVFLYIFTDRLSSPLVVIFTSIGGLTMIFLLVKEMIKNKDK